MLLAMLAPVFPATVQAATQTTYYVAPNGSDSNPGTQAQPFATISKARDVIRTINSNMTGDIYVYVTSGNYYVNSTISFDERDSGTNGYNIIYKSLNGPGTVAFVGGQNVTSAWSLVNPSTGTWLDKELPSSSAGHVYKTNIGKGYDLNTLYVNNTRATLTRYPNYMPYSATMTSVDTAYLIGSGGLHNIQSNTTLPSSILSALQDAKTHGDLEAQIYGWDGGGKAWMTDTIPLADVQANGNLVFKQDSSNPQLYVPKYSFNCWGSTSRFFIQKNLGLLDSPGEFFYDNQTGDLYYYPASGSMTGLNVIYPTTQNVIYLHGSSRTSEIHNVKFDGLTVEDTNFPDYYSYGWNFGDAGCGLGFYPSQALGSDQPSYCEQTERIEWQVGNFKLENTNNVSVLNCHITNAGIFGIDLYGANDHDTIQNCLFDYMGHSGIQLEGGYPGIGGDSKGNGYNSYNTVDNCVIHDVGQLVGHGTGLTVAQSGNNEFSHLEIYNSPRRGIFVTAGYSRNSSNLAPVGSPTSTTKEDDANYNAMNDLYAHDNHFDYIYAHNCQQDGGDDGALFTCYLYGECGKDTTDSKPNYFNQMVIDSVGANPSMGDGSPNNINFDMGWKGIVCSNIKSVNPQNFNCENDQLGSTVSVTNCNFSFQGPQNGLGTFDDSKMDYANIGVQASQYPTAYTSAITNTKIQDPSNVYFKDNFENGIDLTKWQYSGVQPTVSKLYMSETGMSGKQALFLDDSASRPVLYRNFPSNLNKIVSVKVFDKALTHFYSYDSGTSRYPTGKTFAEADDGTNVVALGIDPSLNSTYYMMNIGGNETATSVLRAFGWHTLTFDYSAAGTVVLSIDGTVVKTLTGSNVPQYFNHVSLGSTDGTYQNYYDQFYIYGGANAPAPPPLSVPAPVPGTIQASSYTAMSGVQTEPCSEEGMDVCNISVGSWMDYYVSVSKAGAYTLNYRVAVNTGCTGGINFLLDGVSQKATSLPSTSGGQNWTTVSDTVTLSAGTHTIRLLATANGWNIHWFQLAYLGPIIPGTVQAASYSTVSSGVQTETCSEGGVDVCYISAGSWMDYPVYISTSGVYTIKYRVAVNAGKTGGINFLVDGVPQKTTSLPSTGGWQNWSTVSDTVTLSVGVHTIRLQATADGWNIHWFSLQ
jgi:hypothetical protein